MTRGILIPAAALFALAGQTATAEVVHDAGFGPAGTDARFHTVDHRYRRPAEFGFYYRDRDGFFFGYDPYRGRRLYRDLIRQRYYERYYDHRGNRWRHSHRHYRDYHDRYWRYYRDRDYDDRHRYRHHDRRYDNDRRGRHDRRHRDDDHPRHDRRRGR